MYELTDRQYAKNIRKADADAFAAYTAYHEEVLRGDSSPLDARTTEMIALGVAFTTQCPHCIHSHSVAARSAGVTEEELARVIHIASALRSGGAMTHGMVAWKFFDEDAG